MNDQEQICWAAGRALCDAVYGKYAEGDEVNAFYWFAAEAVSAVVADASAHVAVGDGESASLLVVDPSKAVIWRFTKDGESVVTTALLTRLEDWEYSQVQQDMAESRRQFQRAWKFKHLPSGTEIAIVAEMTIGTNGSTGPSQDEDANAVEMATALAVAIGFPTRSAS